jgi:lipopolysaccharide export system permease protein
VPVRFGILQRHVVDQVFRAFALALLTITIIFVLFVVMAEATRRGLTPQDIARLVPFIIPSSLPYTIPVALLFAVSVVYGRMAGDNEVIAVKAAGQGAMTLIWPALGLGLALGSGLAALGGEVIPRANHRAAQVIFNNLEDYFYKVLKKERQFDTPAWPFFVRVDDVEGREMINATFKHRVPGNAESFDMVVQARRARIHFDTDALKAIVELIDAETESQPSIVIINGKKILVFDLPPGCRKDLDKRIQEKTNAELRKEEAETRQKIRVERKKRAIEAAMRIAAGQFSRVEPLAPGHPVHVAGVNWVDIGEAFSQYKYWELKCYELETEWHLRFAMAFGAFFFVLLGAPVGILFARRDFLSAFICCFVPIIVLYYPLMLAGVNLGKQNVINGPLAVWGGNLVLGVLAGAFALPPVHRH